MQFKCSLKVLESFTRVTCDTILDVTLVLFNLAFTFDCELVFTTRYYIFVTKRCKQLAGIKFCPDQILKFYMKFKKVHIFIILEIKVSKIFLCEFINKARMHMNLQSLPTS